MKNLRSITPMNRTNASFNFSKPSNNNFAFDGTKKITLEVVPVIPVAQMLALSRKTRRKRVSQEDLFQLP